MAKPPDSALPPATPTFSELLPGAMGTVARAMRRRADELERARAETVQEERKLAEQLTRGDNDRPILPVADWINNPYFVGSLANPPGKGGLFDKLREDLVDVFDGGEDGRGYFEVICAGGIGWGKSTWAKAVGLRSLYELSCYAHPQYQFRDMTENAAMVFMNFNVTELKARNTIYNEIARDLDSIDYFKNEFARQPNVVKEIRLPKRIQWRPGVANEGGATSENLVFAIMDECSLYEHVEDSVRSKETGKAYDVATIVYNASKTRMLNRYMLAGGRMPRPAKLILISSARYPEDFVERRVRAAEESEIPVKVMRYREWDTRRKAFYVKGWFKVAVAPPGRRHELLLDPPAIAKPKAEVLRSEGYKLHDVPREYTEAFKPENIDEAIRSLLGEATQAIVAFIANRESIAEAFRQRVRVATAMALPQDCQAHPMTAEVTNLRDGVQFLRDALCVWDEQRKRFRPRVNPRAARYAHFDLSLSKDATGFCVGHVADRREIVRHLTHGPDATKPTRELAPDIWIDLALRINAPRGEEIDLAAARALIGELASMGFHFGRITYDQWQSAEAQQRLRAEGYQTELLSVDADAGPYIALRRALYEHRLLAYDYAPLREELMRLEWIASKNKVDHPPGGRKDVSDALAAVVELCETVGMEGSARSTQAGREAAMPRRSATVQWTRDDKLRARIAEHRTRHRAAVAERRKGEADRFMDEITAGARGAKPPTASPAVVFNSRTYKRRD